MCHALQVQKRNSRCPLSPSNQHSASCLESSQNSNENRVRLVFISRKIKINLKIFGVPKITQRDIKTEISLNEGVKRNAASIALVHKAR